MEHGHSHGVRLPDGFGIQFKGHFFKGVVILEHWLVAWLAIGGPQPLLGNCHTLQESPDKLTGSTPKKITLPSIVNQATALDTLELLNIPEIQTEFKCILIEIFTSPELRVLFALIVIHSLQWRLGVLLQFFQGLLSLFLQIFHLDHRSPTDRLCRC